MPEATAQKRFSCPACGAAAEWNSAKQSLICPSDNPKGIAFSSPGLRGTSYPGSSSNNLSQPQRDCGQSCAIPCASRSPQPRWSCSITRRFPGVARSSQPLADCSNPFGIHLDHNQTNPKGIEIIQPSVAAQRLRWVIAQTIHQL
jgi:hypothetical protein